uniref:Ig-like domain-containing protein n=1 Tax=Maylandia zebra TaxID=106582 RepID=A0A3P9ARL8_9CICH
MCQREYSGAGGRNTVERSLHSFIHSFIHSFRLCTLSTMSVYNSFFEDSSFLWTSILCSAFSVWTLVQGEVLVIGSNLPIIAAPGDDVILPCHLEPMFDVQGMTVEWSKPDLKPNPSDRLSRVEYVHLYRDRQEVPDMKMASYFRRTELFMDDMKHGNISLKILNVSEEDNGRYRCFIPKLRSRLKAAVVELVVDPNFAKTSTTETPLHFQTPDPQDATPANGRSRVSVVAVVITFMSVLVVVAFSACFSRCLHQKLNKLSEGKTTQSQV